MGGLHTASMAKFILGYNLVDLEYMYTFSPRYVINGEIASISDTKLEITELPIRSWTQTYKEQVMEPYLNGSEKTPAVIQVHHSIF